MTLLKIDGSFGEGGGQVLRTSLALSLVTGKPFRISGIRAGRRKPGLLRQHLTCVRAATEVSGAEVEGDTLGSRELSFAPGKVRGGDYKFEVGTAGSTTVVIQTVLPALLQADAPSSVTVTGGTHNMAAPPFDFLERAYGGQLSRMGAEVTFEMERPGFFPAGGGLIRALISPSRLQPLELLNAGELMRRRAIARLSLLDEGIARRELQVVKRRLKWPDESLVVDAVHDAVGPGNVLTIELEYAAVTEIFTGFGRVGVRAEHVANETVQRARSYLALDAPVGEYLCDQPMIPCAIAGSGVYRTGPLSLHATTNIEVIKQFLDVRIDVDEQESGTPTVRFG